MKAIVPLDNGQPIVPADPIGYASRPENGRAFHNTERQYL